MDIKDTLPKSGHVHEVCKEWLVREDGALAYRLQSQEINEFYQGNKFRNAVVRQDFPTALNEQIKEKETAEQEAARYQKILKEQEEADKCLAEEIARKLENDEKLKHLKQLEENEMKARELQDTYVNLNGNNNAGIIINRPIIPISSSDLLYLPKDVSISAERNGQRECFNHLDLSENLICERFEKLHCRPSVKDIVITDRKQMQQQQIQQSYSQDYENFDVACNIRNTDIIQQMETQPPSPHSYHQNQKCLQKDFDIIENCPSSLDSSSNHMIMNPTTHDDAYDENSFVRSLSPQLPPPLRKHAKLINPNITHANIKSTRNYGLVDHEILQNNQLNIHEEFCDLNDLGLATEDFDELNKKLQQEKRDEELARYLQKEEQRRNLTQEEKDRLLAIEAQDKELAIMLQEREKAKAKRAKEKARLKKLQAKELAAENSKYPIVNEPYSNPKDLITDPQQIKFENAKKSPYNILPPSLIAGGIGVDVNRNSHNLNGEDIYTLPVDNTNYNQSEIELKSSDEMSTSISSSRTALSSPSSLGASFHQTGTVVETSPKPPYMPIHDIGNNSSLDGRKKKSKDKCTNQ